MGSGSAEIDYPIHDFDKCLDYSDSGANRIFLNDCYKRCFPAFGRVEKINDKSRQKNGIDVFLFLNNNMVFTIEEKTRHRWFNDLLIEYEHDYYNGNVTPGWIYKSVSNYLAYTCPENKIFYLYSFLDLKQAWMVHGDEWVKKYRSVLGNNREYLTRNVAVPLNVINPLFIIK